MKRVFGWILRILCILVIAAALVTLIRCLAHVNDDYSYDTIMENSASQGESQTEESAVETASTILVDNSAQEDPAVSLYADGALTANRPYAEVTAVFSNISSSILADLQWYVNDELLEEDSDRLLVEGSTVTCQVGLDLDTVTEAPQVRLTVTYGGKTLEGNLTLDIDASEEEVIQTEEIPVTAQKQCGVYGDSDLSQEIASMEAGESGLLLSYAAGNSGITAIEIQLSDGSSGWVDADAVEVSEEDCTTDTDYSEAAKTDFVNSMRYDSETEYLVWVSLYTQKVNVFSGYQGNWVLEKTFDCSTGSNSSPTTTGTYTYDTYKERWDLGTTYVEPVLIFNGGEAFTSRPFNTDSGTLADETMGTPASGGSVRMLEEDIAWMAEEITIGTLVVVY